MTKHTWRDRPCGCAAAEIERLVAALERSGISLDDVTAQAPKVDAAQLNRLVDE